MSSDVEHSISYSIGSKNSLNINWLVIHDGKKVDSTLTSFIPTKSQKKDKIDILDLSYRLNRGIRIKSEHLEIEIVRFAICSIVTSNKKKVAKAVFGRAVNLCRLRLSDLVLSLIYRPLSSLVEDVDWSYYKIHLKVYNKTNEKKLSWEEYKKKLFTQQEIEKGRFYPESNLNKDQLPLWNILCSFTKLDTKLRSFSNYRSNDHSLPIIRKPFDLAILIERLFKGVNNTNTAIEDFLKDADRFRGLYQKLTEFESRFESRLDCCFYSILDTPKVREQFLKFLKDEIDSSNRLFLLEAISSHPLKNMVLPYSKELRSLISGLVFSINKVNHEI